MDSTACTDQPRKRFKSKDQILKFLENKNELTASFLIYEHGEGHQSFLVQIRWEAKKKRKREKKGNNKQK